MTARQILIFDTTLRDGEQAPGNRLSGEEKLRLARQLDVLGVDVIEAGFPAASDGEYRAVHDIAAELRRPTIAALARCHDRDIDLAGEALRGAARGRVHIFISTSALHMRDKLRMSPDEVLDRVRAAVRRARRFTDDVEFSAEDASRSDPDFLCRVVEMALAEGATTINLPDTVGYALPDEYAAMFRDIRTRVPGADRVVFSAHCHDDLGLAVANTLAAIAAGAGQVECTINGIGERAGNAALEEIVMAGWVRAELAFDCGIESRELYRTSQLLSFMTGVIPRPNKAIVGRNAFAHESGIHPPGMPCNGRTYEIISRGSVGNPRKRELLDEDLLALLHESFHDAPEAHQIRHLRVVCGDVQATADVRMTGPWVGERTSRGTGDGPIAAAFTAISDILGCQVEVLDLILRSLTPGRDSVGQAFLKVKVGGKTLSGQGTSTDIVEASARALVNALDKARHAEQLEATSLNAVYLWGV